MNLYVLLELLLKCISRSYFTLKGRIKLSLLQVSSWFPLFVQCRHGWLSSMATTARNGHIIHFPSLTSIIHLYVICAPTTSLEHNVAWCNLLTIADRVITPLCKEHRGHHGGGPFAGKVSNQKELQKQMSKS